MDFDGEWTLEHYEFIRNAVRRAVYFRAPQLTDPEVEDLVQEVSLRVYLSRAAYDPSRGSWESLIRTIAMTAAIDTRRARGRRREVQLPVTLDPEGPADADDEREQARGDLDELRSALAGESASLQLKLSLVAEMPPTDAARAEWERLTGLPWDRRAEILPEGATRAEIAALFGGAQNTVLDAPLARFRKRAITKVPRLARRRRGGS